MLKTEPCKEKAHHLLCICKQSDEIQEVTIFFPSGKATVSYKSNDFIPLNKTGVILAQIIMEFLMHSVYFDESC